MNLNNNDDLVLLALAKRAWVKKGNELSTFLPARKAKQWYAYYHAADDITHYTCLICNSRIEAATGEIKSKYGIYHYLDEHGFAHLKESKMLSFI